MYKVSVIIPLYNRRSLIEETLASLNPKLHSGVSIEIIVVDDGSDDGGVEWIVKNHPEVILLQQEHAGAPAARNRGLSAATNDYILFLDSDDLIEPDFFIRKIKVLESTPEVVATYALWEHFSSKGKDIVINPRHTDYPLESANYENHLLRLLSGWYIVCHALLWRKSVLIEAGGFNTALSINQDVELLFRILTDKNKIQGVNSPKALYREHSTDNRIGNASDESRINNIFNLRVEFYNALENKGLLNENNRKALAEFCLSSWNNYRKGFPVVAEKFYDLYMRTFPQLKLKGGLFFSLLVRILGNRKAVLIRSLLQD